MTTRCDNRRAVAKFPNLEFGTKFQRALPLFLAELPKFPDKAVYYRSKEACSLRQNQLDPFMQAFR